MVHFGADTASAMRKRVWGLVGQRCRADAARCASVVPLRARKRKCAIGRASHPPGK